MPFTTHFDNSFRQVNHYRLYPELYPWVGEHYMSQERKILVLGESHYLSPCSTYHLDPAEWYQGVNISGQADRNHILTRDIIRNGILNGWKQKSKLIYKNIETALLEAEVKAPGNQTPISTIAFYNYFQRPAEKSGQSIRITSLDASHSAATLISVLGILRPNMVIFCGKVAWKAARAHGVVQFATESDIQLINTVHPSTSWWNRKMQNHKSRTGKQVFIDALLPATVMGYADA